MSPTCPQNVPTVSPTGRTTRREGGGQEAFDLRRWPLQSCCRDGRAGRIRTGDPLTPSQVRYQTAPQPDVAGHRPASGASLAEGSSAQMHARRRIRRPVPRLVEPASVPPRLEHLGGVGPRRDPAPRELDRRAAVVVDQLEYAYGDPLVDLDGQLAAREPEDQPAGLVVSVVLGEAVHGLR